MLPRGHGPVPEEGACGRASIGKDGGGVKVASGQWQPRSLSNPLAGDDHYCAGGCAKMAVAAQAGSPGRGAEAPKAMEAVEEKPLPPLGSTWADGR